MNPFDYALALLTILMGLALGDVALSFHRLVVRGRRVRWDGRPMLAAAFVVFECVRLWFAQWTLRDMTAALTFPIYLCIFAQMLLLFLLAAACLPDEIEEGLDLGAFYEARRRYFWGLFTAYHLLFFVLWLVFGSTNATGSAPGGMLDWVRVLAPVLTLPLLMFVRRRWLDYLLPTAFLVFYSVRYWQATLGG